MNIIPLPKRDNRVTKKEIVFKLVELALARGRDITFGSSDPAQYYWQLRDKFPEAMIVLTDYDIKILAKRDRKANLQTRPLA